MKFLLDENVPYSIKKLLFDLGYSAVTLKDENKLGIKNGSVAELSLDLNATIITLDSDFLSIKKELQSKSKIIYIKIHPRDPKEISQIIRNNIKDAIAKLNNPGKVIITRNDLKFESP